MNREYLSCVLLLAVCCVNFATAADPLCGDLEPDVVFLFPSELSCSEYYHCLNGDLTILNCEGGLWFSSRESSCVPPDESDCTLETLPTTGPITEPPTSELPSTTEPPTTEGPTTEPPTTEPPTTEPPTTEPPTTEPPTTKSPTTEPPTTEAPTTEPPTTEPLTTEPPTPTSTTDIPTSTEHSGDPRCTSDATEYFPHPADCSKYIECYRGHSYEMKCPYDYWFSNSKKLCVPPAESDCDIEPTCSDVFPGEIVLKAFPRACDKYLECVGAEGTEYFCENGFYFDEKVQSCNFADLVECYAK